jgi:hypothetical protein
LYIFFFLFFLFKKNKKRRREMASITSEDLQLKKVDTARAIQELELQNQVWISTTKERLAEINKRLAVICPDNDMEQGKPKCEAYKVQRCEKIYADFNKFRSEKIDPLEEEKESLRNKKEWALFYPFIRDVKVPGIDIKTVWSSMDNRSFVCVREIVKPEELFQAIEKHFDAAFQTAKEETFKKIQDARQFHTEATERCEAIDKEVKELTEINRETRLKRNREYEAFDAEQTIIDDIKLLGAPEHRAEVVRLKKERKNLISDWNSSHGTRCRNCKCIERINITGNVDSHEYDVNDGYRGSDFSCTRAH